MFHVFQESTADYIYTYLDLTAQKNVKYVLTFPPLENKEINLSLQ